MKLQEIRQEKHLSASSINGYLSCGLAYKFSHIDHIPAEFISDNLLFGTSIHKSLEQFYQERMIGNDLSLEDLQTVFREQWDNATDNIDNIQFSKDKDFRTLLLDGYRLLEAFHEKLPTDNFTIFAIEEAFKINIPSVSIPIIGAIDLIEQDETGNIIVTDWKTACKSYSEGIVNNNMQLTIYQMAVKSMNLVDRDKEILLKFDCLVKTKQAKYEQCWTTRSIRDANM